MTFEETSQPSLTALCVGHVTLDKYPSGMLLGGSAAYGALTFEALGARSRLVTAAGPDFTGSPSLTVLEVAQTRCEQTTVFENVYPDGGPRRQWVEGLAAPITPDRLPTGWEQPDILFVAPVCGEVSLEGWVAKVRARFIGAGLQGFLRAPIPSRTGTRRSVGPRRWRPTPEVLSRLSLVVASEEDLGLIGSSELIPLLRQSVPVVVITRGAEGAIVHTPERSLHVGTYRTEVKDPTGAGDTFTAAFLYALAQGRDAADAARFASACGSIAVEGEATSALARLEEADRRTDRIFVEPVVSPP